jgi:hypothetical protein
MIPFRITPGGRVGRLFISLGNFFPEETSRKPPKKKRNFSKGTGRESKYYPAADF